MQHVHKTNSTRKHKVKDESSPCINTRSTAFQKASRETTHHDFLGTHTTGRLRTEVVFVSLSVLSNWKQAKAKRRQELSLCRKRRKGQKQKRTSKQFMSLIKEQMGECVCECVCKQNRKQG
jgi:hypothetical protein